MEPTSTWLLVFGLTGGYEHNIELSAVDPSSDYFSSARVALARTRRTPRGRFNLALNGGGYMYRNDPSDDRVDGSASLGGSYQISSRATLSANGSASYVTTDLSRTLISAGIQLPRDQTLGFGGGVGLDIRTGERTSLGFNARYDQVDFESDELLDTQSPSASFRLVHKVSSRSDLSFNYNFLRTNDLQRGNDDHQSSLGWTRLVSRGLTLSLASGVGYARLPTLLGAGDSERWYYYGTAGLDGRIRRSTISLQLRRSVNPAYGLGGNVLSYAASLAAGIPLGRRGRLSISGVNTWSEDPATAAEQYMSQDASASFSVRLVRRLGLLLSYDYRRLDPETRPPAQSHRGNFGLTYTYSRPDRLEP